MEFTYKNDELILPRREKKAPYLQDNIQGDVFHRTYLEYLHIGYSNHYGIEVKPDHIWFTILNEVSRAVKSNPEEYRAIFTDSDEKKDVRVFSGDPIMMPIEDLLDKVFNLIPEGLKKEDIVLNFSTTTHGAKIAFSTAFLEAASPYYTYMMFMCGYNKIRVLGTPADYELMRSAVYNLRDVFSGTKLHTYLNTVVGLIDNIIVNFNDADFWKGIYYSKRCGSGSQYEAFGWFTEFFDDFPSNRFYNCFPPHVSVIEYKSLSTGLWYKLETGLFSSRIENGYLIPDFEFGVVEVTEKNIHRLSKTVPVAD